MKQPISYTDAEIEQIRNDSKWLCVDHAHAVHNDLFLDTLSHNEKIMDIAIKTIDVCWSQIRKYRLHNGPGYRDGIAIDEQAGCKITELKEQGEWVDGLPPSGTVCEVLFLGTWIECKIIGMDGPAVVYAVDGAGYDCQTHRDEFRPILTTKQRTIEAASDVIGIRDPEQEVVTALVELYDAGMLVLPGESE